jgi:hypothetical protein
VGAQQNWWGSPTGPAPADTTGGVDATNPLGTDPGDLPSLAPPMAAEPVAGPAPMPVIAAPAAGGVSQPAPITRERELIRRERRVAREALESERRAAHAGRRTEARRFLADPGR